MADAHRNFADSTVLTAPSPATTGTSLVLASGGGSKMPVVPFNVTVGLPNARPSSTNAEVVRVTLIVGDTCTIIRAQEGSTARAILAGDVFYNSVTNKTLTDIETDLALAVVGPASSVDSIIVGFDGATGKLGKQTSLLSGFSVAVPNDIIPVASILASNESYANIDIAVGAKGTGAFMLQVTDGLVAGGNKRGTKAIDLQLVRNAATQVASGTGSLVVGAFNTASGQNAVVVGNGNNGSGGDSTLVGTGNTVSGNSCIAVGRNLTVTSNYSGGFGYQHSIGGYVSYAMGYRCTITSGGSYSFVAGLFVKSSATGALVFGKGVNVANPLWNTVANSLWFGVNATVPSLAVWNAGGTGLFGKVSIGTATEPTVDSIFDVVSTTRAARPAPSMTTVQRDAIALPAAGMMVYNSSTSALNLYTASWGVVGGGGGGTPATTVASETSYGIAAAVGTGTDYARNDHTHGTMATPTTITGNAGTATALQAAGSDRVKLDGIAAGATANSSDAALIARGNHTGTQVAATISDFGAAVAATAAVTANTAKVTNATHTGDVTGDAALTIALNAVTNAKAAQMATKTYKGRTSAATGDSEDVAAATLKADLALVKADVGLGSVDNTSDADKPVSTAQATAIAAIDNNDTFRTLHAHYGTITAGIGAGNRMFTAGGGAVLAGGGSLADAVNVFYLRAADYPTTNGVATLLRVTGTVHTNAAAPVSNFTFSLRPVTRGTGGAAGLCLYALGTIIVGSNGSVVTAPALATSTVGSGGATFAFPADGWYVLSVANSAAIAANAHVHMNCELQMRN